MAGRPRLDQIDAMRPIKQVGVVATHVLIFFTPSWGNTTSNEALLLLHVSREAFFFISACMLTYAYMDLQRSGMRRFYWRRCVSVVIPYLCWTLIYFMWGLRNTDYASASAAFAQLGHLLVTGYWQLYFLLVIMQFYLVYPLVLALLKRTRGHHGLVLAVTALAQLAICIVTHWNLLPSVLVTYAQENAFSYVLYLVGGAVVAFHLEDVDRWVRMNAHLVVALTLLAAIFAEVVFYLAEHGVTTVLGSGSDPFQPSVIPFNIGAIACGYLAGVALVQPWRSQRVRALVRSGSSDAYGIYLSQFLFITLLNDHHWSRLNEVIPWPVVIVLTVVIVYACAVMLTTLLARTPLAVPLTGRTQVPWSTLIPAQWRAGPTATPAADPARPGAAETALPQPAAVAGTTDNQNGT
ncbi:MAG TPA: acyltransferase [Streptosporangiaceae bacterium]|nr:acyltransferase [Streptosporangiaceae bacterium]